MIYKIIVTITIMYTNISLIYAKDFDLTNNSPENFLLEYNCYIKQYNMDFLFVDTPPITYDEHTIYFIKNSPLLQAYINGRSAPVCRSKENEILLPLHLEYYHCYIKNGYGIRYFSEEPSKEELERGKFIYFRKYGIEEAISTGEIYLDAYTIIKNFMLYYIVGPYVSKGVFAERCELP